MDMNWTDEIRDPEPLKRPIYNAADYDTRHGDPYYREHSTRAPGSISAPGRTNPWNRGLKHPVSMVPSACGTGHDADRTGRGMPAQRRCHCLGH